jgi:Ribonuclease P 40kDa (Rpp40) subunit
LLSTEFLDTHIRSGYFAALSIGTTVDSQNVVSISDRKLRLLLQKVTYQQLGLDGSRLQCAPKEDRRLVEIDLSASSFKPGKALYDRVMWCLSQERIEPVQLICCSYDANGTERTIELPGDATVSKRDVRTSCTSPPCKLHTIQMHTVESKLDSLSDESDVDEIHSTIVDWLGLVHCRMLNSLSPEQSSSEDASGSLQTNIIEWDDILVQHTQTTLRFHTCEGLVPVPVVQQAISRARECVSSGKFPWVTVSVWGFDDVCESWTGRAHDVLTTGDNHYVYVILPDDRYLLYILTGDRDRMH